MLRYKILIALFAVMMTTIECKAQEQEWKKHDVSVIYGWKPVLDNRNRLFGDSDYKSIGMFSAQYVFNVIKYFGIGAVFGYQHYSHRYNNSVANDLTGMLIIRVNWINNPDFTLYSKAGIGMHFMNDNDNRKDHTTTAAIIPVPSIGGTISLVKGFFGLIEYSLFSSQGLFLVGAGYRF